MIKKQVLDLLEWDDTVDLKKVAVHIENGKAQIFGVVSSIEAKNNTIEDIWSVEGIKSVEDRLIVKYTYGTKTHSDRILASKIERRLDEFPIIDRSEITISVDNGIVTLAGYLDAYWKYIKVRDLCNDVVGVLGVINNIIVVPPQEQIDKAIAEGIYYALERYSINNINSITVKVNYGTVTLCGNVDSWIEYRNILGIAENIPGINNIVDDLIVNNFIDMANTIPVNP
jgi:osmotically-inducible protein OsmY